MYYTATTLFDFTEEDIAQEGLRDEMANFMKHPAQTIVHWIDKLLMAIRRLFIKLKEKKVMMVPDEMMICFSQALRDLSNGYDRMELRLINFHSDNESDTCFSNEELDSFRDEFVRITNTNNYRRFMSSSKTSTTDKVTKVVAKEYTALMMDLTKDLESVKMRARQYKAVNTNMYRSYRIMMDYINTLLKLFGKLLSFEKDSTKLRDMEEPIEIPDDAIHL